MLQGCRDILSLVFQRFHSIPTSSDGAYTDRIQACVKVLVVIITILLSQQGGRRDGEVVRALASHLCGPGLIFRLGIICGLSLLLVLILVLRAFSPGTPVFPPS